MSDDNNTSQSSSKPTGVGGLRSRIAAFESGSASNASKGGSEREIPHANLNNLRQRFDIKGDKPLVVRGSFGLGGPPLPGSDGVAGSAKNRAVSLGGGRAVSPMQTSSVNLPIPRSISTAVPLSVRPTSPRSLSTTSSASTATSSLATNTSSLLPGPLAATLARDPSYLNSGNLSSGDTSGLRTPMSSISLSSMAVEAGSTLGDGGSTEAAEDDLKSQKGIPLDQVSPVTEVAIDQLDKSVPQSDSTVPRTEVDSITSPPALTTENVPYPSSAALHEKSEKENVTSTSTGEDIHFSVDTVQQAKEELERYKKEEPSASAPAANPNAPKDAPAPTLPTLDVQDTSMDSPVPALSEDSARAQSPSNITSPVKHPLSISRRSSLVSPRLRRSDTAQSLTSSHPESDLADTNLETFDDDEKLSVPPDTQRPAQEFEAGPKDPDASNEMERAKQVADSIAPAPLEGTPQADSDAPIASPSIVAETVNKLYISNQEEISSTSQNTNNPDDSPGYGAQADQNLDLDEAGLPKVKCSDCGDKVSVLELGEHVCETSSAASPTKLLLSPLSPNRTMSQEAANHSDNHDQEDLETLAGSAMLHRKGEANREGISDPEDVPTSDFSPSSSYRSHKSTTEKPDVPDDEMESVKSGDNRMECK